MHLQEFFLHEGRYDQYIFKAIYVCGPPGSGKNFVMNELGLLNMGLKLLDVDEILARLEKKHISRDDYERGERISLRRQSTWARNYLGMAISTTGRMAEKTIEIDRGLHQIGYDTLMLFVDVTKETAIKRITSRPNTSQNLSDRNRRVDLEYFDAAYEQIKYNIPLYETLFGDNFITVTNEESLLESTLSDTLSSARKKIRKFLDAPISKKAQEIISQSQNIS